MTKKQSTAVKLRELEKKLDFVKSTFAKILRKQKRCLDSNIDFDINKHFDKLTVQYEALQKLQAKLLSMSSNQEEADYNDAERHKLLTIIKKNYFLQKNLGVFLTKNKSRNIASVSSKNDSEIENQIIVLGKNLKVKELFLDDEGSMPAIKLTGEYKVIEQLIDEMEQTTLDDQLEDVERADNDLSQIVGLSDQIAKVLKAGGIDSIQKLAELSPEEVSKMDKRILFRGKFKKYNWVGQAQDFLR